MKRAGVWMIALSALCACSSVLASKAEYGRYRVVRLAQDDRTRLIAMAEYATNHPDGRWAEEVSQARSEQEDVVWARSNATSSGLAFYLQAYPDGRYAQQARPRLAALRTVEGRRQTEQRREREVLASRREETEERRRTWMTRAFGYWSHTLLGVGNWGAPMADVARANPDFSRAFGENPRPRCTRDECVKFYQNTYAIPVPGATRIERDMHLVLRLKMDGGRLERAELLLPNKGFSRWYEMENRTLVTDEDPTDRQRAIDWVVQRVQPVIAEAISNARALEGYQPEPISALLFTTTGQATGTATPGSAATEDDAPAEDAGGAPANGGGGTAPPAGGGGTAPPAGGGGTAPPAGGGGGGEPSVEDLLNQAAGVNEQQPQQEAPPPTQEEAPAQTEGPMAPVVVGALTTGALRVVVFAASPEDYGTAFDGLFIERVRAGGGPAPARPAGRRPAAPRRRAPR